MKICETISFSLDFDNVSLFIERIGWGLYKCEFKPFYFKKTLAQFCDLPILRLHRHRRQATDFKVRD